MLDDAAYAKFVYILGMSSVQPIANSSLPSIPIERRNKPRIQVAFPALVRGNDADSGKFQEDALVDNVSASGVYLRLNRFLAPGSSLFVVLEFSQHPSPERVVPRLAAHGTVVRSEVRHDGTCGLAIRFLRHRFLDSAA